MNLRPRSLALGQNEPLYCNVPDSLESLARARLSETENGNGRTKKNEARKKECKRQLERKLRLETATGPLRRWTKKEKKSGEDGSYTELLKLAMETDGERKARLKKMVATTQLRLAPETEDERRARLEYLSDNPIYIPNNLYLILIVAF